MANKTGVFQPIIRSLTIAMNCCIIPPTMTGSNQTPSFTLNIDGSDVAHFVFDGGQMTLDHLDRALDHKVSVEITNPVFQKIEASCQQVRDIAAGNEAAYGINTGFGSLCKKRIPPEEVELLQTNLILSHAVGVGETIRPSIVRWMMLLKIFALTHGVSGISRETLECLMNMLRVDVLPIIPSQGSLGASGDLAPLAHMVLPMIGQGNVHVDGQTLTATEAFQSNGITPVTLGPKEGLALINGTQFMAAHAAHIVVRSRRLMKQADIISTMSLEGAKGSVKPFDEKLHQLRPHAGAIASASNVRKLMAESQILDSHVDCDRVQDPYSLRCIGQVHGASRDALEHAACTIEIEINSVTDNPIIFEDGSVISGGLFHGQPLALTMDYLAIALAEIASISERRIYLLLSGVEELPMLLMKDTGLNSGFMLPQYTAAALVSENKGLCTPSSVDSIPTSLGQEDHVSMGARSAVKCLQVLENTETVLAIEQMCASQAIDFRAPLLPGVGPRIAHGEIRKSITHADTDRLYGEDIRTSLSLLRSYEVVRVVEKQIGKLQ